MMHGTALRLIDCVIDLLDQTGPEQLLIEEVLSQSGVSKGSLYYHFEDFPHLVETALVVMYERDVCAVLEHIQGIRMTASCADDLVAAISLANARVHAPSLSKLRFRHSMTMAMAGFNARLAEAVAPVQKRLIDGMAQFIAEAQAAGWANRDCDPRAIAVLIQSYTLGRLGNELCPSPVAQQDWLNIINVVIRRVLAAPS